MPSGILYITLGIMAKARGALALQQFILTSHWFSPSRLNPSSGVYFTIWLASSLMLAMSALYMVRSIWSAYLLSCDNSRSLSQNCIQVNVTQVSIVCMVGTCCFSLPPYQHSMAAPEPQMLISSSTMCPYALTAASSSAWSPVSLYSSSIPT